MSPLAEHYVPDVVAALGQHGFVYSHRDQDGWIVLTGALSAAGEAHPCVIAFDPLCIDIPTIRLCKIPDSLKPIAAHINDAGYLCYIAEGTIVLDVCDPVGQMLACIRRAEEVLSQIINNGMADDLEAEFFAYWNDGGFCFSDIDSPGTSKPVAFAVQDGDIWLACLSDDEKRTSAKMKLAGFAAKFHPISVVEIKTEVKPTPRTDYWPPKTVQDILAWQAQLDSRARKKIADKLFDACRAKPFKVLVVISSPLMRYAFLVHTPAKADGKKAKIPLSNASLNQMAVSVLHVYPIDNSYIVRRNIPELITLMDKKIALVGCGTIGGYLSDLLLRMGAGSGKGSLTLIDSDSLQPQNIGRHRLGAKYLLKKKADALQTEAIINFPGMRVTSYVGKAQDCDFRNYDLVINATGEQAFGHWLQASLPSGVSLLTVWIEGPGVAVRSLLSKADGKACFRCLKNYENDDELRSVTEGLPQVFAGQGCEGAYVPFPAFVSSHAANLAAEMVLDWVNGSDKARLQTRVTQSGFTLATPDCSPAAHKDCPICHI